MNDQLRELLNRLNGKYGQKYGHLMDDWTSMVLEEIHENFAGLTSEIKSCTQAISQAQKKIKTSQRAVHFGSTREAMFYALGVTAPAAIAATIISILIFWYAYTEERFQKRRSIIDAYENVSDYVLLMQGGQVIERDGVNYLVLRPAPSKGNMMVGEDYIYDHKNKRVLVPLGRK